MKIADIIIVKYCLVIIYLFNSLLSNKYFVNFDNILKKIK